MSNEPKTYAGSVTTQAHLRELWTILGASTQQEARRAVQQLLKKLPTGATSCPIR
jgi:hypothetical protein